MKQESNNAVDGSNRRRAIEGIIASYPSLTDEQLEEVLRYLKREASAMDQAMIASNPDIKRQYGQLSRDHYLDRLRPTQVIVVSALGVALALCLVAWGMLM
jgi:hypothetical protein